MTGAHRQHGLTLIEIMIAMIISLFLMAGVIQIFSSNKVSSRFAEALGRVQENGRFASEFIARELRMAGYLGCVNLTALDPPAPDYRGVDPLVYAFNPQSVMFGTDETTEGDFDALVTDRGVDPDTVAVIPNSDVLRIRKASSTGANFAAAMGAPTDTNLRVAGLPAGWGAGTVVIVSNCDSADVLLLDNVTVDTTPDPDQYFLQHTQAELATTYGLGARAMQYDDIIFYVGFNDIDADGVFEPARGEEPGLWWIGPNGLPAELVPGIEDMQVLYGVDPTDDGVPDYYAAGKNVPDWGMVVAARIALLARSSEGGLFGEAQTITWPPSAQWGAANEVANVDTADQRLRQTFTATVTLRNRMQ